MQAMRCGSGVGLLTAALLCSLGLMLDSVNAEVVWQRPLDAPSSERLDIHLIDALADDGFRVTGGVTTMSLRGGFYAAVQDFDADARPKGPPRIGPLPTLRSGRSAEPDVVVPFEPAFFLSDLRTREPVPCRRRALGGGIEERVAERAYHSLSYEFGGLDGEGGAFAASWGFSDEAGLLRRLYRQQPDCSAEDLGAFAFHLGRLVNSRREALVFAGSSEDNAFPVKTSLLRAFDRSGQRWSLPLAPGGVPAERVSVLLELDGEVIVGASSPAESALYRVDAQGNLVWTRLLGSATTPLAATHTAQGLLVTAVMANANAPAPTSFSMVDAQTGVLAWQSLTPAAGYAGVVRHADPQARRRLALHSDATGNALIELDGKGGARSLGELPRDVQPLLQRSKGDLLATRGSHFGTWDGVNAPGRRLLVLDPTALAALGGEGAALRVSWPQRPLALEVDGDDAWVLSQREGRHDIESFDGSGARRWRHLLPALDPEQSPMPPSAALIASTHVLCESLRRSGSSRERGVSRLSCLRRADGRALFTHLDLLDSEDIALGPLRAVSSAGDGAVVLLAPGYSCAEPGHCRARIERLDIEADGALRRSVLFNSASDFLALLQPLNADGFLILAPAEEGGGQRFIDLGLDGSARTLAAQPAFVTQHVKAVTVGDAGVLVALEHPSQARLQLLRIGADGSLLWQRELEARLSPPSPQQNAPPMHVQLVATDSGESAVLAVAEGALVLVRLRPDGQTRWQLPVGRVGLDGVLGMQMEGDSGLLLGVQRDARLLLRRLDAAGEEAAHAVHVLDAPGIGGLEWVGSGDALLIAGGALAHGAPPQPASLQRLRLVGQQACSAPPPAGFWFDPGSDGQGLFLHPAAGGAALTAAWLGFAPDGRTDRADLRWLSLFGETDGQAAATLALQESRGGRFAHAGAADTTVVGTLRLQRPSCSLMVIDYQIDHGELAGHAGRRHLLPAAPPSEGALGGIWFAPEAEGQGLLLQGLAPAGAGAPRLVGAWLTFDPDGAADDPAAQHWFTLDGVQQEEGGFKAAIVRTIGGSFEGRSTANHLQVGQAELRVVHCSRLELSYRFDEGGAAAEFAGLEGQLSLQRLDGCPLAGG